MGYLVKKISLGDRVVINPKSDSFCCKTCESGCVCLGKSIALGVYMDGGFAEYCIVPEYMLHLLPKCIALEQAVLSSTLCDVLHAWKKAEPVLQSAHILVIGAGSHGLMMVAILHAEGYRTVTVSEPKAQRRERVTKLAPEFRVLTPDETRKLMRDDRLKADLVLDCSGNINAIQEALVYIKYGGKLVLHRCSMEDQQIVILPLNIISKEIKIIGSLTNSDSFPEVLQRMESLGQKYMSFENLGIVVYGIGDYEEALLDLEGGRVAKVVFKLDKHLKEEYSISESKPQKSDASKPTTSVAQSGTTFPLRSQLVLGSRESRLSQYFDPNERVRSILLSRIFKELFRKSSHLPTIEVPDHLESVADKSLTTIYQSLVEAE